MDQKETENLSGIVCKGEYDVIIFKFLKLEKEGGEGGRVKGERGGGRGELPTERLSLA